LCACIWLTIPARRSDEHLEKNEIFTICNTQNFGHIIFYSPKSHDNDVMAEKTATFQLLT